MRVERKRTPLVPRVYSYLPLQEKNKIKCLPLLKKKSYIFFLSLFLSMNQRKKMSQRVNAKKKTKQNRFSLVTTVFRSNFQYIFTRMFNSSSGKKNNNEEFSYAINEALHQRGIIISTLLSKE